MAEEQKQPTAQEIPEPQQPTAQENTEPQQAMENQVTSQTPATKPAKNPKRVLAGKKAAEKTKQAREAQEKALAEAHATIENYKRAEATAPPAPEPKPAAADSNGFTTNQWIAIIGIGATLLTTYVKRDDIKAFFAKKQDNPPELEPVVRIHKSPPQPRKGIRKMD